MQTSRRTFLRVLGSTLVGVAVTPRSSPPLPTSLLTYEGFERAYHAAADPGEPVTDAFVQALEPWFKAGRAMDRAMMDQLDARETGLLYDVELAA